MKQQKQEGDRYEFELLGASQINPKGVSASVFYDV